MPWLWLLLGLMAVLVIILALPVTLGIRADGVGQPARVRVQAFAGLLEVEGKVPFSAGKERPKAQREAASAGHGNALRMLRSSALPRQLWRLATRLLRAIRVRELSGVAEVGLDDPAETGELWAVLAPASLMLSAHHPGAILRPHFAGECLRAQGRLVLMVIPLEVLGVLLTSLLAPTTLRALAQARRAS